MRSAIEWDILNQEVVKLYRMGKYDRAVVVAKKALGMAEESVGLDRPDVATSLNNLAFLYETQGQYAQAEPLYKRSLAIREKALGPNHPSVAESLNNLAGLYDTQGQYALAEPLYKRSLAIAEQSLGPDHPDVATSLNNLAALYRATKREEEAETLDWLWIVLGIGLLIVLVTSLLRPYLWLLTFGILLFISGALNCAGVGNYASEDEILLVINFFVGLSMIGSFLFICAEQKQGILFLDWLTTNREELVNGPVSYNGMRLSLDTELVQFQIRVSLIARSTKLGSRYFVEGYELYGVKTACFLITICFGWWSTSGLFTTDQSS